MQVFHRQRCITSTQSLVLLLLLARERWHRRCDQSWLTLHLNWIAPHLCLATSMENTTSCAASMNHLHVLEENKRLRAEVARLRIQLKSEEDATRNPVTLAYHTDTKEEHTPEASVLGGARLRFIRLSRARLKTLRQSESAADSKVSAYLSTCSLHTEFTFAEPGSNWRRQQQEFAIRGSKTSSSGILKAKASSVHDSRRPYTSPRQEQQNVFLFCEMFTPSLSGIRCSRSVT